MTIETFEWSEFWASAWTVGWMETGALIASAFLWRRLRASRSVGEAKSVDVRALFWLAAVFAFELTRKLFNDLDIAALFYAALFIGAGFDWWKARSRSQRERRVADLERRKAEAARRREFWGGGSSDGSSRRRRRSRRSGRGDGERSSSGRSRRSGSSQSRRDGDSSSQSDERSGE